MCILLHNGGVPVNLLFDPGQIVCSPLLAGFDHAGLLGLVHGRLERSVRMRQERLRWMGVAGMLVVLIVAGYSMMAVRVRTQSRMLEQAQAEIKALANVAEHSKRDLALLTTRQALQESRSSPQKGSRMFGSNALDVVVGLAFLVLLLALVCTVVTELVAALTQSRARLLERGKTMVSSEDLGQQICRHPLIQSMSAGQRLSYIPSRAFSVALVDMISGGDMAVEAFRSGLSGDRFGGTVRAALLPLASQSYSLEAGDAAVADRVVVQFGDGCGLWRV